MSSSSIPARAQVVVVGSGAGGAVTAATLAEQGYDVLVLEEGPRCDTSRMSTNSPEAIARLYRSGGLTPILGTQTIAFVEGRCVGGSTEINSAFWHRLPPECYARWQTEALLEEFTPEGMEPHFEYLEAALSVSRLEPEDIPRSSQLFRAGIEKLGWGYLEVPRAQAGSGRSAFDPGAKQSMQRTFLPRALGAGATLVSDCRAVCVRHDRGRAHGVLVVRTEDDGSRIRSEIHADTVVLAGGPIQTPALLRRSGIKRNVGNSLRIHPMIKAAALFDEDVEAHEAALPVYQVKEFWPTITLGGSVFTPGFLAMLLAENWTMYQRAMPSWRSAALYYAATRSMARGTIRVVPGVEDGVVARYNLSRADERNLSVGLGRLGEVLFAAGARAVFPSARAQPILKSADQCRRLVAQPLPIADLGLSSVHAFSSCPMGENPDLCATDSFGKVHGFTNLYVNDASLLPDSPGVNPQGATMAVARRNVERFIARDRRRRARPVTGRPPVLVTGATGWLGSRLVARLVAEGEDVRCLVLGDTPVADHVAITVGDIADPAAVRALCRGAEGGTLFHVAGVIHPALATREFERVNVAGTQRLLDAAAEAGVRRIVAMSSNSPAGVSSDPDVLFDERSPDRPYMGYGRSKARMEALLREVAAKGPLEAVILRSPWFYGPHQPSRQTRFFRMIKDGRFPIVGSGGQRRSLAYVDDICEALLLAARAPRANGQTYWIADERPYTILEIVETVEQVLEEDFGLRCRRRRLWLPAAAGDAAAFGDRMLQAVGLYSQSLHVLGELAYTIACSIAKAKTDLGFAPASSLRDGMAASVEWCLTQGERI